jgi:hypothetical protein
MSTSFYLDNTHLSFKESFLLSLHSVYAERHWKQASSSTTKWIHYCAAIVHSIPILCLISTLADYALSHYMRKYKQAFDPLPTEIIEKIFSYAGCCPTEQISRLCFAITQNLYTRLLKELTEFLGQDKIESVMQRASINRNLDIDKLSDKSKVRLIFDYQQLEVEEHFKYSDQKKIILDKAKENTSYNINIFKEIECQIREMKTKFRREMPLPAFLAFRNRVPYIRYGGRKKCYMTYFELYENAPFRLPFFIYRKESPFERFACDYMGRPEKKLSGIRAQLHPMMEGIRDRFRCIFLAFESYRLNDKVSLKFCIKGFKSPLKATIEAEKMQSIQTRKNEPIHLPLAQRINEWHRQSGTPYLLDQIDQKKYGNLHTWFLFENRHNHKIQVND